MSSQISARSLVKSGGEHVSLRCLEGLKRRRFVLEEHIGRAINRGDYHDVANPQGYISLHLAQNRLSGDVIDQKLLSHAKEDLEKLPFAKYYNHLETENIFKTKLSGFFDEYFGAAKRINPENLLIFNGVDPAIECLVSAITDPGDYILMPVPQYNYMVKSTGMYLQTKIWPIRRSNVGTGGTPGTFELTVDAINAAYQEALNNECKVKAILVINPDNPTGNVLSRSTILEILTWADSRKLHVIFDEIYALSVFDPETQFASVLSLPCVPNPTMTHFLWGFSKDFCVPGFFCGALHTENALIQKYYKGLIYHDCPLPQKIACLNLISDPDWLSNYVSTNKMRLHDSFNQSRDSLQEMGVIIHPAKAGLFLWVNFSKFLTPCTYGNEEALFSRLIDAGVAVSPGWDFSSPEPGWYRIVFANKQEYMGEGLDRIKTVLGAFKSDVTQEVLDIDIDNFPTSDQTASPEDGRASSLGEGGDTLEGMLRRLKADIKDTDWLTTNTAESWERDNPDIAAEYRANIAKE